MAERLNAIITDFRGEARRTMSAAMVAASQAANSATARQVEAVLDVFARDVGRGERRRFFQTLGERAQRTVVRSYASSRAASGGPAGYRANDPNPRLRRYAGGRMLRALQNPSNVFEVTERGIMFGPNAAELDRTAKQWFRLNFGALPQAGRRPERFQVSFSNLMLFSVGFDATPSRTFAVPESGYGGYFNSRGEFHPLGTKSQFLASLRSGDEDRTHIRRRPTRGIRARHFFDRGLERFVRDLSDPGRDGVGLSALYYRFYKRGLATVKPTRPPRVIVGRSGGGLVG